VRAQLARLFHPGAGKVTIDRSASRR